MRNTMIIKHLLAAAVTTSLLTTGHQIAQAAEPAAGLDLTGKIVYLAANGRLRYGDSLLSRVYSHTSAALELKGIGTCTVFICPVMHNGISLYARRSRLDLDRPTNSPVVTERTLRRGDDGEDVKAMQQVLVTKGFAQITPDGNYGSGTEEAVRDFQRRNGLKPDGEIGAETRNKLAV